jgi:hypothetical protein
LEQISADWADIRFSAGRVEYGEARLQDVDARLRASGAFELSAKGLYSGRQIQVGPLAIDGRLHEFQSTAIGFEARGLALYEDVETSWSLASHGETTALCLSAEVLALEVLARRTWADEQDSWVRGGEVDTCFRYGRDDDGKASAEFDFSVAGLSFDSPGGVYAGEALELDLHGEVGLAGTPVLAAGGSMKSGEILLGRLYVDFDKAPLTFSLAPEFLDQGISALSLEAWDDGAARVQARVVPDADSGSWTAEIAHLDLKFPTAYRRYVEPVAAAWALDGLEVTGAVNWSGAVSAATLRSGPLEITDLSVVDTRRNRFALTGFNTSLTPGESGSKSSLSWRGLLLGRFNLGPGTAVLDSEPGAFALAEPLDLDVLGGRIRFERLGYVLPGSLAEERGKPRFEMQAVLDDIEMEHLTTALGWPRFSGRLSGEVPGVRLENGVLSADGEVRIDVFGGEVRISDLAAERPFGVLPSLSANITLSNLDLEQLTETFEFGRISGIIDGSVTGLRMLDWSPVAFDGWIGTPERQGRSESISRQAVNNLTTIGGGGVATALSSPLLRMFNSFSYRRLGLGCRLRNYVCEVSGIREDDDSVLLLEGAGIPKITVRAWNRRVDWPQMVANLAAISSGGEIQVGDAPEP